MPVDEVNKAYLNNSSDIEAQAEGKYSMRNRIEHAKANRRLEALRWNAILMDIRTKLLVPNRIYKTATKYYSYQYIYVAYFIRHHDDKTVFFPNLFFNYFPVINIFQDLQDSTLHKSAIDLFNFIFVLFNANI